MLILCSHSFSSLLIFSSSGSPYDFATGIVDDAFLNAVLFAFVSPIVLAPLQARSSAWQGARTEYQKQALERPALLRDHQAVAAMDISVLAVYHTVTVYGLLFILLFLSRVMYSLLAIRLKLATMLHSQSAPFIRSAPPAVFANYLDRIWLQSPKKRNLICCKQIIHNGGKLRRPFWWYQMRFEKQIWTLLQPQRLVWLFICTLSPKERLPARMHH